MSRSAKVVLLFLSSIGLLVAVPSSAQGFGAAKEKVTLQRKLPALVHMPGDTIKVTVTSSDEDGTLPYDFQALLETELLKDDPNLRDDDNPSTQIICQITEYSHPDPVYTNKLGSGHALARRTLRSRRSRGPLRRSELLSASQENSTSPFRLRTRPGEC